MADVLERLDSGLLGVRRSESRRCVPRKTFLFVLALPEPNEVVVDVDVDLATNLDV